MSSRLQVLADRREALIARSDEERAALGAAFVGIERKFVFVEAGFAAVRRVNRRRALLGAAAAWMVLAPLSARLWIGRLSWWLPLATEGYRLVTSFAGARRAPKSGVSPP